MYIYIFFCSNVGDQFWQNCLLIVLNNKLEKITAELPKISAELPGLSLGQLMTYYISAELDIGGGAEMSDFSSSYAEIKFGQKYLKRIPQVYKTCSGICGYSVTNINDHGYGGFLK